MNQERRKCSPQEIDKCDCPLADYGRCVNDPELYVVPEEGRTYAQQYDYEFDTRSGR